jgi:hypothetical protein
MNHGSRVHILYVNHVHKVTQKKKVSELGSPNISSPNFSSHIHGSHNFGSNTLLYK